MADWYDPALWGCSVPAQRRPGCFVRFVRCVRRWIKRLNG